jgi:hypothetical protein
MGDSGVTEEPKRQDRDAQRDEQKNTRGGKVVEFFRNNPTLVLTLLYLYVTAIGLIYSWVLYRRFGINIFDYSEISDFLLAAFKNPLVFVYVGAQGVFVLLPWLRIFRKSSNTAEVIRSRTTIRLSISIIFLASVVIPSASAIITASSIKGGEKTAVGVRYRSFSSSTGQVTEPGLELIGATQKAVFFYDVDDKHTLVIPQSQIVSIEVPE